MPNFKGGHAEGAGKRKGRAAVFDIAISHIALRGTLAGFVTAFITVAVTQGCQSWTCAADTALTCAADYKTR